MELQDFYALLNHIFYPWHYTNIDAVMNNVAIITLVLIAVPGIALAIVNIKFKMTSRESNNSSIFLVISFFCLLFFVFYWYVALPLSIACCFFVKWANSIILKTLEKDEIQGITAIGQYNREEQKKIGSRNQKLKNICIKRITKRHPNQLLILNLFFYYPLLPQ